MGGTPCLLKNPMNISMLTHSQVCVVCARLDETFSNMGPSGARCWIPTWVSGIQEGAFRTLEALRSIGDQRFWRGRISQEIALNTAIADNAPALA